MTKQIKPQQITERIEQLISEQKEKGYKAGWVFHQMDALVEKNWKHLCHAYQAADQLARYALQVAEGALTIEEMLDNLNGDWEIYQEMELEFGG